MDSLFALAAREVVRSQKTNHRPDMRPFGKGCLAGARHHRTALPTAPLTAAFGSGIAAAYQDFRSTTTMPSGRSRSSGTTTAQLDGHTSSERRSATVFTSNDTPPLTSTRILSLQPSRHFWRSLIVVGSYRVCIVGLLSAGPVASSANTPTWSKTVSAPTNILPHDAPRAGRASVAHVFPAGLGSATHWIRLDTPPKKPSAPMRAVMAL